MAIVEDVSDQKYAERRCMQEEQLREMLSVDVLISGKVNLTKNQVEELWGHRSFPAAFQKVQDCDGLFQLMGEYLANAEERKRYRALFRRQALLAKYRAGDRGIWGEYRCVNFDGEILWAALRATIHEDPETGDILLFGYVRDIDSRKKTELALLERAEKDGVTGLYNKATIQTMIQRILQERRGSGGQCALLVIDLDNFKQVNDRYGHLQGDKLLQEIGHILHASFQQKGLVGRIGGDEFVLFLGEIPSEQWVLEQTDALCRMLNIAYEAAEDHVPVSASIGVGLAPHSRPLPRQAAGEGPVQLLPGRGLSGGGGHGDLPPVRGQGAPGHPLHARCAGGHALCDRPGDLRDALYECPGPGRLRV